MTFQEFIHSDESFHTIAAILALAWTLFRSSDWFVQRRTAKVARALAVLETAVARTYEEYVRAIKASRADGKLTDGERREARQRALNMAMEIAREEWLPLLHLLGRAHVERHLAQIVKRAKG